MEDEAKTPFTKEERVRLWFLVKDLIRPPEPAGLGAEVGGEEMWELHELLQKVLGRLDIGSGDGVPNMISTFVQTAPESELLDMIELLPYAQARGIQKAQNPFRQSNPTEIHRRVNEFLDRIGHPARFDARGKLVRENFAVRMAPTFEKMPRKADLLDDLIRLLSTGQSVAVMFIDLDNFKSVNDTIGHDEGDKCLERVVRVIGSAIASKGRMYRYAAGDEFMAVLPNFDEAEACATAERIRKTIESENTGGTVKVTASIGIVVATHESYKTAEEVLKTADSAMYESKGKGGNAVSISPSSDAQAASSARPISKFVSDAALTVSVTNGWAVNFTIFVRNDSDVHIHILGVGLKCEGHQIGRIVRPPLSEVWEVSPQSGKSLSWNASPNPAAEVAKLLPQLSSAGTFNASLDFVLECLIEREPREIAKKVKVSVDARNLYIVHQISQV